MFSNSVHYVFQPLENQTYTGKSELNSTTAIKSVEVAISSYYADGLLESCKDVQFPSNNQKVGLVTTAEMLCVCIYYLIDIICSHRILLKIKNQKW